MTIITGFFGVCTIVRRQSWRKTVQEIGDEVFERVWGEPPRPIAAAEAKRLGLSVSRALEGK